MRCSIGKLLQVVRLSSGLCKSNENLASKQMNQRKPMEIEAEWEIEYVVCLVNNRNFGLVLLTGWCSARNERMIYS